MAESEPIHGAIRRRFAAYRAGLLDADSTLDVRAHLRACADCRAAFEVFAELPGEAEPGRFGHVPRALLARWDAALARLSPAERALLEAHLATCAECAAALQFSRRMRAIPPRTRGRSRLGFAAGAAAALVAALLVVAQDSPLRQDWDREAHHDGPPPAAVETPGTPPAAPRPGEAPRATSTRQLRAAPVQLGPATRGGAGQVVRVAAGTTTLPLRVPPLLGVGPAARIHIDVTGPGGAAYGHADLEHRKLFGEAAPPALEASAPDGGALPAGHYDVSAVSDAPDPALPGSFEHADYGFDLQLLSQSPTAP